MIEKPSEDFGLPPDILSNYQIGMVVRGARRPNRFGTDLDFLVAGEEFCERLIPSWEVVRQLLEPEQPPLRSFLTPPVTDFGLDRLRLLLDKLAEIRPDVEIVINDWGVERLLLKHYPFPRVFGRLLNKQSTDPRVPGPASHVQSESYQRFLRQRNICRIEWNPRWEDGKAGSLSLPGSLRWPEIVISWTRSCLAANLAENPDGRASIGVVPCKKPCLKQSARITKRGFPGSFVLRGNALLERSQRLPTDLKAKSIDRIVIDNEPWP